MMANLKGFDGDLLRRAGFYREKRAAYAKGGLPKSENLIAFLVLSQVPLEIFEHGTGETWVLTFQRKSQLELPLKGGTEPFDRN